MAVAANALTTLTTAKAELGESGSTYDSVIERLINAVSDAIEGYCNRTLYYSAAVTEKLQGLGGNLLFLSRTPVVAITSIELLPSSLSSAGEGTTLSSSSYVVRNAGAGIVYRRDGFSWSATASVGASASRLPGSEDLVYLATYGGGYVTPEQGGTRTLPYDIEQACLWGVANVWRHRGRELHLQQESEDMARLVWATEALPSAARKLLEEYRRRL